ncbi:Replication factor C small subunit [uncultured virus]|nr:Replication factor C small subunit [uncultured virus]
MENSNVWIEKYRPQNIEDIVLDPHIHRKMSVITSDRPNVHLIISGLPGTGKTTSARCIARRTLGDNLDQGYLELNAAEDRGVRSISNIIPPFCKRVVGFNTPKVILFDEADNLTAKCQHDIGNLIKRYGERTRFIFTCNDSTKIVEDIQSVCTIIRYKRMTDPQICIYLKRICECETIVFTESGLSTICYISDGDMRRAINDLQKTAYTHRKIDRKSVLSVCKVPDPDSIKAIIDLCLKSELVSADKALIDLILQGYYYPDIITGFSFVLTHYANMREDIKLILMQIVFQTKIAVCTGLRSRLQLSGMVCRMVRAIKVYGSTGATAMQE